MPGPTVREAPPYVFRRQTEVDLKAARWNLLAWEDPRHPQWASFFQADVAMVEARVAEPGPYARHSWRRLVHRAEATFAGLRLLDGTLVLKVSRGRETGQIEVIDGAAFDPALSGLEVVMRKGGSSPGGWVLVESLDPIVFRRSGRPVVAVARRVTAKGRRRRAVAFATGVGIGGNACVARERRVYGRHAVLLGC